MELCRLSGIRTFLIGLFLIMSGVSVWMVRHMDPLASLTGSALLNSPLAHQLMEANRMQQDRLESDDDGRAGAKPAYYITEPSDNSNLSNVVVEPLLRQQLEGAEGQPWRMFPVVRKEEEDFFKVALSVEHRDVLLGLMDEFHAVMAQHNLTYFVSFGTLLGSYRHHGIIPWDDDIDVMIPNRQRARFAQTWSNLRFKKKSHVDFLDEISTTGKVFSRKMPMVHRGKWRNFSSPYVDLFFYDEDDTNLWHLVHEPTPKIDVFPLTMRPLSGRLLPAPRDPYKYLVTHLGFNIDDCYTGNFQHMEETFRKEQATVKCRSLLTTTAFVRHSRGPAGAWCREDRVYRGRVMGSFIRSSHNIPVC